MKIISLFILAIFAALLLCSCGHKMNYSPLDNYLKATTERQKANTQSRTEAQQFLDSLNNK
jgi:hypothetical protein